MEVKKRLAYSDKKNTRTKEVDIVRGLTIVLIVATDFAYSPLLISKLGNTLCFTIFLMLFGFSIYVSVIKHGNHRNIRYKIMHKVIILEMLTVILVSLIFPHKLAQLFTPEERFPPTILFIGLGTSVGFGLLLLARSLKFEKASKIIETLGKNSLGIYVFHIAILKLLNYKTFITITGPMEKTFMFGFLLFGYFPVNSAAQLVSVKLLKIGYFKLLGKRLKQAIT